MVDVFAVADIIVKHIKTQYPQDVAIVGYYGSYLQGRATARSDLDFFFIPATDRGRQVECQFIIEDAAEKGRWPSHVDRGEHREIYVRYGYPDLVALLDPADLEPLRVAVLQLINKLENHLKAEGVSLNQFDSVAAFESFYIN